MKYKSISCPAPSVGIINTSKRLVVPDQSMSLEEILSRFTRGESVAIGHETSYHESEDDLEKLSRMDLVDKGEYIDKLRQTQRNFENQEKRKAERERKRLADELKAELKREAERAAKKAD